MNEKDFKKTFKLPVCTVAPWYSLLPKDEKDNLMRKIRQETIELYGHSMDECPKRKVCLTKTCIGRPLPWKSKTALPYLEKLKTTHNIQNDELFISNCDSCTISKTCKNSCYQINDYLNRGYNKEPELVIQENLENHTQVISIGGDFEVENLKNQEIPWDCLTNTRQLVVKKYLYEGKDFLTIAKELDITNQARAKYEFYSALTRLSEFAVIRKFIDENENKLTSKQKRVLIMIYKTNLSLTQVASIENMSKQSIQQIMKRLINKFNIKWSVFVRKQKGKTIYNVPGVFK